ncbi:aromatic ring-hydroxylating dioxygenase subunit alpha [Sphingomonas sp. 1P06PA]|uniref:aromatic ring-hydroxylating oxygenase subunit alpha n=1 Tax=Sphingomonas sp. 1P06PA TaxID=554121 RepID=UPI0039A6B766
MDIGTRVAERIEWEARRDAPPADFPALPEIPGGRYTRDDFFAAEQAHVWRKAWVPAGRTEDLKEPGSYRMFEKLGVPIILVRGRDGILRGFYNTCRHRGAPVVREEQGRTTLLRCQYHSWSYGLDGKLIGVPDERDFACLNKADRGLLEVACAEWGGLAFINLDKDASPLAEHLGPLVDELACVGMDGLRTVHIERYVVDCNWKAAMDAFLEVYHINTIHPTNAGIMLDSKAAAMGLMPGGHSRMATRKNMNKGINFVEFEGAPDIPSMPDLYRLNNTAYCVFPNLITPVEPTGFPLIFFWPRGRGQTEIEAVYVAPDWGDAPRPAFWDTFLGIFHDVMLEDMQNLAPIQKSLDSEAFTGMMINYQERRIYWFHEEIDRRLGAENIPEGLAVKQVLEGFVEEPLAMAAE